MKAKFGVQKGMKRVFGCASEKNQRLCTVDGKKLHLGAIYGCFGALRGAPGVTDG